MNQQAQIISKLEVTVQIHLATGDKLDGVLFARQYERVSDILNDARPFIPFMDTEKIVHLIAKDNIHQVIPAEQNGKSYPEQDLHLYQGNQL